MTRRRLRLEWSAFALADRNTIFDYIEADSPQAAITVDERIREQTETLARFPESGRPGRVEGTRELVIPAHHTSPHIGLPATPCGFCVFCMRRNDGRKRCQTNRKNESRVPHFALPLREVGHRSINAAAPAQSTPTALAHSRSEFAAAWENAVCFW